MGNFYFFFAAAAGLVAAAVVIAIVSAFIQLRDGGAPLTSGPKTSDEEPAVKNNLARTDKGMIS